MKNEARELATPAVDGKQADASIPRQRELNGQAPGLARTRS
jgi:hypothetical protein